MKAWNNGQLRELSAEEIAVIEADRKEFNEWQNQLRQTC